MGDIYRLDERFLLGSFLPFCPSLRESRGINNGSFDFPTNAILQDNLRSSGSVLVFRVTSEHREKN